MVIGGVPVHPGRPCPHSTGQGCDDYEHRPVDPCHNFNCGWILPDSPLPEWMQPCKGKVIVIFNVMRWNGVPVDLAVPVGRRIPPRSLAWLKKFAEDHGRPLIYTEQIVENGQFQKEQNILGHGPPAFQQDLIRWRQEGRQLWKTMA
jgi:hypothetical protein